MGQLCFFDPMCGVKPQECPALKDKWQGWYYSASQGERDAVAAECVKWHRRDFVAATPSTDDRELTREDGADPMCSACPVYRCGGGCDHSCMDRR
jgi:hypothetical protein